MRGLSGPLAALALVAAASAVSPAWALDVGDKAPALDVKEWIQGGPVALDQLVGKKIAVVEFWATWCPPCKKSIPHLSKLADRFRAQIEIVGVSDEAPDVVREFAKTTKFGYSVCCDNNDNTKGAYDMARRDAGIPHAFVIDRQGTVVWQGNPLQGLDAVVEKVVAGKFDMEKSRQAAALRIQMLKLIQSQDADQIGPAADKVLELEPSDGLALDVKFQTLKIKKDEAAYKAFVSQLAPKLNDDWRALNDLAWRLATDDGMGWRDIAAAYKAAKRGVELSQSKEPQVMDTLARVHFEAGLLDQAIEHQKKAVALDASDADLKKTLAYYESCAELRKQVGGAAAPAKKR